MSNVVAQIIAAQIVTAIEDATRFDSRLDPSVRAALEIVAAQYAETDTRPVRVSVSAKGERVSS
jgi:hypothetical protein